jgi:hypothetical protein
MCNRRASKASLSRRRSFDNTSCHSWIVLAIAFDFETIERLWTSIVADYLAGILGLIDQYLGKTLSCQIYSRTEGQRMNTNNITACTSFFSPLQYSLRFASLRAAAKFEDYAANPQ